MVEMWSTVSIVGAIFGGTGFEGLWQRPNRSDGLDDPSISMGVSLLSFTFALSLCVCFWHAGVQLPCS
jgi:hypothetical protein